MRQPCLDRLLEQRRILAAADRKSPATRPQPQQRNQASPSSASTRTTTAAHPLSPTSWPPPTLTWPPPSGGNCNGWLKETIRRPPESPGAPWRSLTIRRRSGSARQRRTRNARRADGIMKAINLTAVADPECAESRPCQSCANCRARNEAFGKRSAAAGIRERLDRKERELRPRRN